MSISLSREKSHSEVRLRVDTCIKRVHVGVSFSLFPMIQLDGLPPPRSWVSLNLYLVLFPSVPLVSSVRKIHKVLVVVTMDREKIITLALSSSSFPFSSMGLLCSCYFRLIFQSYMNFFYSCLSYLLICLSYLINRLFNHRASHKIMGTEFQIETVLKNHLRKR